MINVSAIHLSEIIIVLPIPARKEVSALHMDWKATLKPILPVYSLLMYISICCNYPETTHWRTALQRSQRHLHRIADSVIAPHEAPRPSETNRLARPCAATEARCRNHRGLIYHHDKFRDSMEPASHSATAKPHAAD